MRRRGLLTICLCLAITSFTPACHAYLPTSDPYVDVYFPQGLLGGSTTSDFVVDTPNYTFTYNVARGVATSFKIKNTGFGTQEIYSSTGPGCHAFSAIVGSGSGVWYSSSYDNTGKYVWVRKAGKYLWEVRIEGITLRTSAGVALPNLTITQVFYFWPDKIYSRNWIYASADIPNVQYMQLSSYYSNGIFDRYNCGSGDLNVKTVPYDWMCGSVWVPDQFTFFHSGNPSRGGVTQSAVDKSGLDCWCWCVGRDAGGQATTDRLKSDLWLYNRDWHGGLNYTWPGGYGGARWISTAYYVSPWNSSAAGVNETNCDLYPLSGSSFAASSSTPTGVTYEGFDATMGCYVVKLPFDQECIQETGNVNRLDEFKLHIANDNRNRNIRLQTYRWDESQLDPNYKGFSDLTRGYATTLCDAGKVPTGVPVQHSKKWDGGTNANYTQTYVCLPFSPNEANDVWLRTTYVNWGNKPLVGIPSLDLIDYGSDFGVWLEAHIGNCETACYTLDDKYFPIAQDIRAHQVGVPEWCSTFARASGIALTRPNSYWKRQAAGMRWDSVGPCLAQLTWNEQPFGGTSTSKTTATCYLIPSASRTRLFYKFHTDFTETITFSNIKRDLVIFSLNDPDGGDNPDLASQRTNTVSYLNSSGTIATQAVDHSTNHYIPAVPALPLYASKPFVTAHDVADASVMCHDGFVVHSFSAKIDGATYGMGNLSAMIYAMTNGKSNLLLTPNVPKTRVKSGDYIDAVIEVLLWEPAGGATAAIETERLYNPATVSSVYTGTNDATSFFPCVTASGNVADFAVTGGVGYSVIRAKGFRTKRPMLWEYIGNRWTVVNQQVSGADGWQVDYVPSNGTYTFTFAVPVVAGSGAHRYKVTNPTVAGDVNEDGKTDIIEFSPTEGKWRVLGWPDPYATFGANGYLPSIGDYDGDHRADVAAYYVANPGGWQVKWTSDGQRHDINWGGWDCRIPACLDVDGNGIINVGEWIPTNVDPFVGQWYASGVPTVAIGVNGDIPVPGDYDGDGKDDYAVYHVSNPGAFQIIWSSDGQRHDINWGGWGGRVPVCADWDGDGATEPGEWVTSTGEWYVYGHMGVFATLGANGDIPILGDYDGDGFADVAVYHPAGASSWLIRYSSDLQRHDVGAYGTTGRIPAMCAVNGLNGLITTHPQPSTLTKTVGQSVTYSVVAQGSGLAYQWYKNGAAIGGATSSTYSKANLQTSDSGAYKCRVTNWNAFQRYSLEAVLTVQP